MEGSSRAWLGALCGERGPWPGLAQVALPCREKLTAEANTGRRHFRLENADRGICLGGMCFDDYGTTADLVHWRYSYAEQTVNDCTTAANSRQPLRQAFGDHLCVLTPPVGLDIDEYPT